jgi:hypothetical protein
MRSRNAWFITAIRGFDQEGLPKTMTFGKTELLEVDICREETAKQTASLRMG